MSNRKRQTVLKDFSQLKPIDERIEILASSICRLPFYGQLINDFKPRSGTQMERAWKMNKLTERQQIAWQYFCDDMNMAEGKSGGVTSPYGDYVEKSDSGDFRVPVAYVNSPRRRLERLLLAGEVLSRRERALLSDLAQDYLRGNSSLTLESIGLFKSGYKDKVSARAAGIAHLQNLMDRLADFYDRISY
jgi:hypothetical protein